MATLHGNAVVGQSGGPTSAINATLAGVIRGAIEAKNDGIIETLYGMRYGIEGCLAENFINLTERFEGKTDDLMALALTPAAALGSCRKKMKAFQDDRETYERLFEVFKKYNIRYFFYIGGNDSMDTVYKLSEYAKICDYEIRVVGVPKTVDNDLMSTDHTPGFGSAAKFVATTTKEILRDISVYTVKAVTIVEIMGRDAGWLTASSALPVLSGGFGPDLIYLPEVPFSAEQFLEDVRNLQKKKNAILVCISEGARFADGRYVGEGTQSGAVDVFGHKYLAGAGKVLEDLVKSNIGCKVRSIELSLPQRCAAHIASKTDIDESLAIGANAVKTAIAGQTAVMMTFVRRSDEPYSFDISTERIENIANAVRVVPREYINEGGNQITEEGLRYLLPLVCGEVFPIYENGMPKHIIL